MNQILGITLKLLRRGRFSAVAVLVGLGLLFTAAGAKAGGCAVPYKAGAVPAIPFVSPHADGESNQPATIVGLWHVIYTGTYDDNFPPGGPYPPYPSRSSNPSRPGTPMELNLKMHFSRPPAGISASASGRT
jgi:hypothetical protein